MKIESEGPILKIEPLLRIFCMTEQGGKELMERNGQDSELGNVKYSMLLEL